MLRTKYRDAQRVFVVLNDLVAFGQRLREARTDKALNQEDFAALGGVKKNSQVLYEGGKQAPSLDYLYRLRDHGVDIGFVITGFRAGEPDIGSSVRQDVRRYASKAFAANDDDVEVAQIDPRFGLGGVFMDEAPVPTMRKFSRAWLRQISDSPPDQLYWAPCQGNSMAPTIGDGDIVLIDRQQLTPRFGDLIWAIAFGQLGMIKRLRPMPDGSVKILSDNSAVPPEVAVEGELYIFGRVVAVIKRI